MMEILELPGGRLADYHVAGSGIPALLFPGSEGDCQRQYSVLFPHVLRTYRFDLPGLAEHDPEERARQYEEARSAIGLRRVVVAGHGSDAAAALAYAAMYPERTAACVVAAPDGARAYPRLERVCCRTLIIVGQLDLIRGVAQAGPLVRRVPRSELVVLPDGGRRPAVEAPGGYRQVVLDFLRG